MLAAISTGPVTHLDHLAPLCFLLNAPLIVTDEEQLEIGKVFYPMVNFQYVSLSTLSLEYIASHFDTIITCAKFWAMELKPTIRLFFNKELRFIFAPHGYSDKEDFLEPVDQDINLTYSKGHIEMGNLRLWFYKKHQAHFDTLASGFFKSPKKTVLYAPTWETKATGTSFFEHAEEVVSSLATEYHLLIKLHPLLEENNPAQFHRILGKYDDRVQFIHNFPAIYPLLEKTAIYLGDFSSIGYDFLTYNRPMFFLKEGGKLSQCGEMFNGSIENAQHDLIEKRQEAYDTAFGKDCSPEKIKDLLLTMTAT